MVLRRNNTQISLNLLEQEAQKWKLLNEETKINSWFNHSLAVLDILLSYLNQNRDTRGQKCISMTYMYHLMVRVTGLFNTGMATDQRKEHTELKPDVHLKKVTLH